MAQEKMAGEGQYLTFKLSEEVYAIEIIRVREVLDYTKVTKVPNTPDFMEGVINLRGGVVPVVDLRLKFGMDSTRKTVDTCIIIADVTVDDEQTLIGALADSVKEVIDLEADHIEPAPKIGTRIDTDFIQGMGKRDGEFIIILDINKVFSVNEFSMVQAAGETVPAAVGNEKP
jgi:purine-binding chemotaxis protein CheW